MAKEKREYTFAGTFPTGTHAMWMHYGLAAAGINPLSGAKLITVPWRPGQDLGRPNYMKFFNDGAVNFPYLSDGMWFLTQHKRWGLLKSHPDYLAVGKQVNQIDLYKSVASAMKINVPMDVMRTSKLIDGVVWDGKGPAK